ncbi:unnamed protein product [Fraxinus pennsylvanica]|uniref:COI1 F-box domain-containing protein n=1 Tax=Fraxinus pennsylvanica TaxID=56036 RepID=A0AAD1Z9E8_9LAMI|nr:unnamed protein product [Fraxinus pennsylvanica]
MRGFDLINVMLPDEIMVEIFRSLESNENREAASLVCKRWLHLARLSCETIHIGFSTSTDALVELLIDRFVNVRDVFIDESPFTSLALKMLRIQGGAVLLNLYGNSIDGMTKCCLSDSGLAAVGDGSNYAYWKVRTRAFLKALDGI